MINYYKYLPVSEVDESWGLYVLNAGCNEIKSHTTYPAPTHPAHHYFRWDKGRLLNEYQIIYISKGKGVFESSSCKKTRVHEGCILLLFPGEWHRFKPDEETGWDEFWVGCKGSIIENLTRQNLLTTQNAVLDSGVDETIIYLFTEIIEETKGEKTGYQPLVAGIVMHLLGKIYALTQQRSFKPEDITENIITKARIFLRTNITESISMEDVAKELNVSYAWFRKAFKTYTGIAPNQYLLQLRIEKAKELLNDKTKSIKQIASELHFDSFFYFSRLFKNKIGISPEQYRNKLR